MEMHHRLGLAVTALAVVGSRNAGATTLFNSFGFESSAGYSAAPAGQIGTSTDDLLGQPNNPAPSSNSQQWSELGYLNGSSYPYAFVTQYQNPTVNNTNLVEIQAVGLNGQGSSPYASQAYWRPNANIGSNAFTPSLANATNIVNVTWQEDIPSSPTSSNDVLIGIGVYANTASTGAFGTLLAFAGIDTSTLAYVTSGYLTGTIEQGTASSDTFHNLDLSLNYSTNTFTFYADGAPVQTDDFLTGPTASENFTDADLTAYPGTTSTGTGYAFIDNYAVSAVPEPATVGLLGIAGVFMMTRRRRIAGGR